MVSLALGKARVELAPKVGGAIAQFTFAGVDVLRRTPSDARTAGDVRAHACYPLVPYSNRIANARLAIAGGTVELARNLGDHPNSIHGVGWQRAWQVVSDDGTSALLALEHAANGADARAWPWPFRATQWFGLAAHEGGSTLTVKLAIVNTGDAAFPFGLGLHPFFPRTAGTSLDFDVDGVWENDATLLPVRRVAIPSEWRHGLIAARREHTIDNVFTQWKGVAMLTDPARPFDIGIAADRAAGFVVVYAPAARDFLPSSR
jgi:aldose 1-epimerase